MPSPASATPLTRLRWLGVGGSALLGVGSAGAGVLPVPDSLTAEPVLQQLRSPGGKVACVVIAAVGMAVLVSAWWRLRDRELAPRWVIATAALWSVPLLLAPPLFSRDVYSYAAVGDLLTHGLDPYTHGPGALPTSPWLRSVSSTWRGTPAPYGPLYLELTRLVVLASGHLLHVVVLLLRLASAAGVALTAAYLPRLARACGVDPGRALWLAVASPLVLAHYVSGGHNDALMVGLLIAGLAYAAERRGAAATVLIALAAAVKAPALVALPFVALLWSGALPGRWAVAKAGAYAGAVAAGAFTAVTIATGLGFGWISAAKDAPGLTVQWTSVPTGFGMATHWLHGQFREPPAYDPALAVTRGIGTAVLLVILVALLVRAWRRRADVAFVVASVGWALFAAVLLAAAFHPWYLPWAVAPLAASESRRRVVGALAWASAALCFLVLPDGFSLARVTVVPGVVLDIVATAVVLTVAVRRLVARRAPEAVPEREPVPSP